MTPWLDLADFVGLGKPAQQPISDFGDDDLRPHLHC